MAKWKLLKDFSVFNNCSSYDMIQSSVYIVKVSINMPIDYLIYPFVIPSVRLIIVVT